MSSAVLCFRVPARLLLAHTDARPMLVGVRRGAQIRLGLTGCAVPALTWETLGVTIVLLMTRAHVASVPSVDERADDHTAVT